MRRIVIGLMGSGTVIESPEAWAIGRWVAERGYCLLTGGGKGVMAIASEAFCSLEGRRGVCIGVIPCGEAVPPYKPKAGYPNPWVEVVIATPLTSFWPEARFEEVNRNYVNVLSSDVIIALPGGVGTNNEIELAGRLGKPILLFGNHNEHGQLPRAANLSDVESFVLRALPQERC